MVRVWKTKSPLFCLRYDPLIVFWRQNHTTYIFTKMMSHDLLVQMAYFPCGTTNKKYASSVWNFCSRSSNVTGFAGRPKVASRNVFVFSGLFISKEFTLTETFTLDVQWHIVSKNAFIWYVLHLTEYASFFCPRRDLSSNAISVLPPGLFSNLTQLSSL